MTVNDPTVTRTPRANNGPMPTENPTTGVRSAAPSDHIDGISDLANTGKLLCFRPVGIETFPVVIDGRAQNSEATIVQVVGVADGVGGFVDYGEHPVFWTFVRKQLAEQCDEEFPWLVGRLEKGRRSYRIMPATPDDVAWCDRALGMFSIAEAAAAEVGDEPF